MALHFVDSVWSNITNKDEVKDLLYEWNMISIKDTSNPDKIETNKNVVWSFLEQRNKCSNKCVWVDLIYVMAYSYISQCLPTTVTDIYVSDISLAA